MAVRRTPRQRAAAPRSRTLQLLVEFKDARPRIWRRLLVADHTTLAQMHTILQVSMGWYDYHLHLFKVGGRKFEPADAPGEGREAKGEDESKATLASLGLREGSTLEYDYDFGDGWELRITVENADAHAEEDFPRCIGGGRAGPLEDCGGIPGLEELLDAFDDPWHERHDELRNWAPSGFDPAAFSATTVTSAFIQIFVRRRS